MTTLESVDGENNFSSVVGENNSKRMAFWVCPRSWIPAPLAALVQLISPFKPQVFLFKMEII